MIKATDSGKITNARWPSSDYIKLAHPLYTVGVRGRLRRVKYIVRRPPEILGANIADSFSLCSIKS